MAALCIGIIGGTGRNGLERDRPPRVIGAHALRGPITAEVGFQAVFVTLEQHVEGDLADRPAPTNHPADLVRSTPLAHRPFALSSLPCDLYVSNHLSQLVGAYNCREMVHGPATSSLKARPPKTATFSHVASSSPVLTATVNCAHVLPLALVFTSLGGTPTRPE